MLGESLIDLFFSLIGALLGTLEILSLPTHLVSTLATIISYGTWVVGSDILVLFIASVLFWWGIQTSIGLAVWLWDRLPLT